MAKTSTCCLTFSLIAVALSFGGLLYLFTSSILPDIRAYLDPPDPPASATVAAVPSQFKLSTQPPVEEQFPVSSAADPTHASEKLHWIDQHLGHGISELLGLHDKKDAKADQTSKSEFDKEKAEFRALVDQREREFHEQETDLAARQVMATRCDCLAAVNPLHPLAHILCPALDVRVQHCGRPAPSLHDSPTRAHSLLLLTVWLVGRRRWSSGSKIKTSTR